MATIDEYFALSNSEQIILVEITLTSATNPFFGGTFYISDRAYYTVSGDFPASVQFSPIIAPGGMPRLHRGVDDPMTGRGSRSYGTLKLTDDAATFYESNSATSVRSSLTVFRGDTVVVKRAAPRHLLPYTTAQTLFTGEISRVGGDSSGLVELELIDTSVLEETFIVSPLVTYTGGATDIDVYVPLIFGEGHNVTGVRPDKATLDVLFGSPTTDDGYLAFDDVFDDGVELIASQYTENAFRTEFELDATPAGRITADVMGLLDHNDVYTTQIGGIGIINNMIFRAGISITQALGGASLLGASIVVQPAEEISIADAMTFLYKNGFGFWTLNRGGGLFGDKLPVPRAGGREYTPENTFGRLRFKTERRVIRSARIGYKKNHTVFEPAAGATAANKEFMRAPFVYKTFTASGTLDNSIASACLDVETAMTSLAGATEVATAIFNTYKNRRYWATLEIPFTTGPLLLDIGDSINLSGFRGTPFASARDMYVMGVDDILDGKPPRHRLKVFG